MVSINKKNQENSLTIFTELQLLSNVRTSVSCRIINCFEINETVASFIISPFRALLNCSQYTHTRTHNEPLGHVIPIKQAFVDNSNCSPSVWQFSAPTQLSTVFSSFSSLFNNVQLSLSTSLSLSPSSLPIFWLWETQKMD